MYFLEGVRNTTMQYSWKSKDDPSRDLRIYEITRNDNKKPFTVVLRSFSKVGDKQLFSDLFWSDDWDEVRGKDGTVSDDIKFCIGLWKELGLEDVHGAFHPKHIEHDLDRFPIVYRNTLENVMSAQFGQGCGHSIVVDDKDHVQTDTSHPVIPLVFDCSESEEEVNRKIFNSMQKYL